MISDNALIRVPFQLFLSSSRLFECQRCYYYCFFLIFPVLHRYLSISWKDSRCSFSSRSWTWSSWNCRVSWRRSYYRSRRWSCYYTFLATMQKMPRLQAWWCKHLSWIHKWNSVTSIDGWWDHKNHMQGKATFTVLGCFVILWIHSLEGIQFDEN